MAQTRAQSLLSEKKLSDPTYPWKRPLATSWSPKLLSYLQGNVHLIWKERPWRCSLSWKKSRLPFTIPYQPSPSPQSEWLEPLIPMTTETITNPLPKAFNNMLSFALVAQKPRFPPRVNKMQVIKQNSQCCYQEKQILAPLHNYSTPYFILNGLSLTFIPNLVVPRVRVAPALTSDRERRAVFHSYSRSMSYGLSIFAWFYDKSKHKMEKSQNYLLKRTWRPGNWH